MQLIESRFSTPCCGSFIKPVATGPVVPSSGVPIPAGAFHTPRALSVVAYAPATYPLGATAIGSPLTGSVVLRYGKYSAPFWLCGMLPTRLSILGRPLPMTWKAVACSGGSTIAKARLRSANDNAALITTLSATPGTTRMLKISTLSSDEFSWKTGRKSLALKVVETGRQSPSRIGKRSQRKARRGGRYRQRRRYVWKRRAIRSARNRLHLDQRRDAVNQFIQALRLPLLDGQVHATVDLDASAVGDDQVEGVVDRRRRRSRGAQVRYRCGHRHDVGRLERLEQHSDIGCARVGYERRYV